MKTRQEPTIFSDSASVTPDLRFNERWDADAVSALIRSKCEHGETPAFLFIGREEAGLLRSHLAGVFGAASTLHGTYYMGLEIVEIACESFMLAGSKTVRTLRAPLSRRPEGGDRETEIAWRSRI